MDVPEQVHEDWINLRRLLYCMKTNEDMIVVFDDVENDDDNDATPTTATTTTTTTQSWHALLLRAQLAQDLWKSISTELVTRDFDQYQELSREVDHLCRRAHDLANQRRLKEEEDEDDDIIEALFFGSPEQKADSKEHNAEAEESAEASSDDEEDDEDYSDTSSQPRHSSSAQKSATAAMSYEDLQKAQREQMEEAISQMARHMVEATQGISSTLQQQNTGTLNELETVAEQNVQEVTKVASEVQQHNQRQWRKNLSTWSMMFSIVGVFVFAMLTIFTLPKDPNATLLAKKGFLRTGVSWVSTKSIATVKWIQQESGFFVDDDVLETDNGDEEKTPEEWDRLFQENEAERLQKQKLDEFLANRKDEKAKKEAAHERTDWRSALLDGEEKEEEEGEEDYSFGARKPVKNKIVDSDETDPFGGRKPVKPLAEEDDPFGGRTPVKPLAEENDPFGGKNPVKPLAEEDDPFGGRKPVKPLAEENDPFGGRKPVATDDADKNLFGRLKLDLLENDEDSLDEHPERRMIPEDSMTGIEKIEDVETSQTTASEDDSEDSASTDDGNENTSEDSTHRSAIEEEERVEDANVERPSNPAHRTEQATQDSSSDDSEKSRQPIQEGADENVAAGQKTEDNSGNDEKKPIGDPKDVDMDNLLASLNRQAQLTQKERATKTQDGDAFARTDYAKTRFSPKDLRMAAYSGDFDLVRLYVSQRPEYVNRQDKQGWTPAMFAARKLDTPIVELFLNVDSFDLEVRNKNGDTALDIAKKMLDGENHPIIVLLGGEPFPQEALEEARRQAEAKNKARRLAEENERRIREEQDRREREHRERIDQEERERLAREEARRQAEADNEARFLAEESARRVREEQERQEREHRESIEQEDRERLAREEARRRAEEEEFEAIRLAEESERLMIEEQERLERERFAHEEQERFEQEEALRLVREEEIMRTEEEARLEAERRAWEEQEEARKMEEMRLRAIEEEKEDRQRSGEKTPPEEYFEYVQEGRNRLDSLLNEQEEHEVNDHEAKPYVPAVTDDDDELDLAEYVESGRSRLDDLLGTEDDHDEL